MKTSLFDLNLILLEQNFNKLETRVYLDTSIILNVKIL